MIRTVALLSMLFGCTTFWCTAASGQVPFDPGMAQPFYGSPYGAGFSPYGGVAPMGLGYGGYGMGGYGYGGLGYGGYGLGGYGYGRFGYGMRGYYPPNPFGNLNMLPPNPPSPYYVVPSAAEYRAQTQRLDQAKYGELIIQHSLQQR